MSYILRKDPVFWGIIFFFVLVIVLIGLLIRREMEEKGTKKPIFEQKCAKLHGIVAANKDQKYCINGEKVVLRD